MTEKIRVTRRRLISGLVTVGAGSAAAGAGTMAYFSDTETSADNTVRAGTLDLSLDEQNQSITFLDESGIVPGDSGSETVELENTGTVDGDLEISVDDIRSFDKNGNSPGELENYLHVQAEFDAQEAFDSYTVVSDIQVGDILFSELSLPSQKPTDFVFEWDLPSTTENKAKGTSVEIDLTFSLVQSGGG